MGVIGRYLNKKIIIAKLIRQMYFAKSGLKTDLTESLTSNVEGEAKHD